MFAKLVSLEYAINLNGKIVNSVLNTQEERQVYRTLPTLSDITTGSLSSRAYTRSPRAWETSGCQWLVRGGPLRRPSWTRYDATSVGSGEGHLRLCLADTLLPRFRPPSPVGRREVGGQPAQGTSGHSVPTLLTGSSPRLLSHSPLHKLYTSTSSSTTLHPTFPLNLTKWPVTGVSGTTEITDHYCWHPGSYFDRCFRHLHVLYEILLNGFRINLKTTTTNLLLLCYELDF